MLLTLRSGPILIQNKKTYTPTPLSKHNEPQKYFQLRTLT